MDERFFILLILILIDPFKNFFGIDLTLVLVKAVFADKNHIRELLLDVFIFENVAYIWVFHTVNSSNHRVVLSHVS